MIKEIRDGVLYFDGCNTVDLAKEYGTPLYVFSETDICSRFDDIKKVFLEKYPKNRVAYAAKAFCCTAMCKLTEREGMCMDVVSGGELFTAIKAGFPAERIEFNGNNKTREELELAIEYGIGRIIADGLQELALIEDICREKGKRTKMIYRITPGVKSDSHDYIVTGRKDSKFGFPLDDDILLPAVKAAIQSEYVDFEGFHFHVGSQLFDNGSHLQALDIALNLIKKIKSVFSYDINELNVGGGFGITYTDEERKPYSYFLEPIMDRIVEFCQAENLQLPAIVIEPGRSIVGEAGITLYKIGTHKTIPGIRSYVSVDGGMTDNIRPALYGAEYDAVIANKASEPKDREVTICGKCCESGDILIKDIMIPEIQSGDIVAIFSTGAYGYSMANNYNRNPIPGAVLVKDGRSEMIIKPQSYEHMTDNDIIPDSLK